MAEYIEREALKEHLKSYAGMFTDEIGFAVSLESVLGGIDFQPAADVVEVVRCKDCKHSRERNEYERNYLVDGVLICTSPDAADGCWNAVWDDHWCKCGERRDNDATD